MTWWQAIILGVVEGLTEYLPVSSTGHLLVTQAILGIGTESAQANAAANAYAICIQAGAILAVLGLYWRRVRQCSVGWAGKLGVGPGDEAGFRIGLNMLVAFMPAAVIGLIFDDWIEEKLFGMWPIVVAWFVGGVAILATVWWKKRQGETQDKGQALDAMTWRMALAIGFIQCLAMWPGTSRSLVTIVGGVLVGMSLASAVEFSFLLGVITLCAATVYKAVLDTAVVTVNGEPQEMLMVLAMAHEYGWLNMVIGSVAAWASAVLAVTWMVAYLKKHGMEVFGYYRIAIAIVVAALLLAEVLAPATR
ncbi:MAG: undecaprenyl-diphosphate phosphatase [Planctomycetota bacterium]